ncbi:MAG TPA: hypothetical protein VG248_17225 [Caulobacteraceae bacterium]|jgi:prophage tail gpP-like protein|nr:hypothetical protein [Caulobacteraceae bacterium]
MASDELTLVVGDSQISGWTDVRVTRRIEACPNDFEIAFTERFPGEASELLVQAGQACVVQIGPDAVVTGYLDRYTRGYSATDHTVSISGRGKTQDLVDCSAEYPTGQISGQLLAIAQALAQPYGISVSASGGAGAQIPQFNLTLGETAYDIIERICRSAGLLPYEDVDGNLVLANTSSDQAACGFQEGVNVQAAHVMAAMDQRYSEVDAFLLSMDVLGDTGQGGNLCSSAPDPNVPRHRKLYIIAEAGGGGIDIAQKRATWEVARRSGRGLQATITTDSWRDSAGTLWTPNTQAPIDLPGLKLTGVTWTIGEVTYRRGAAGTTCELTLMDPSAFQPEPILLLPTLNDVKPGTAAG